MVRSLKVATPADGLQVVVPPRTAARRWVDADGDGDLGRVGGHDVVVVVEHLHRRRRVDGHSGSRR